MIVPGAGGEYSGHGALVQGGGGTTHCGVGVGVGGIAPQPGIWGLPAVTH